jgi:hypothetical protein
MFEPNVTIADQNYLGRGLLLLVTPKGRRMVRHAITTPMMRSKWYQLRRENQMMLFLQGDWDQDDYDGRTLMFIEASGETQEFFSHLLDDANNTTSELSILFSD